MMGEPISREPLLLLLRCPDCKEPWNAFFQDGIETYKAQCPKCMEMVFVEVLNNDGFWEPMRYQHD